MATKSKTAAKKTPKIADCGFAGYHQLVAENGERYGSFKISYGYGGWYWQACFPGCLPDGEPVGPFDTSLDAYHDAVEA